MNPEEMIALAEKYEQWATGWAGVNAPGPLEIPDCLAREYRAIAEGLRLLAGLPQSPKEPSAWMRTWPDGCVTFSARKPQQIAGHKITPLYADTRPDRSKEG